MTDSGVHKLGEVLRAAREAKGVDLVRVERDTKIRSRYLSALEAGEYRDLPSAVYTKGFLRNYGLYLGLDPEYLIDLYRLETAAPLTERPTVGSPPRPIAVRRRRSFVVTPGVVVAVILTMIVLGIFAYLGGQLIAFAGTPDLQVTDPPGSLAAYDGSTYTIHGTTAPGARVSVKGLAENPIVDADARGAFAVTVRLEPGTNVVSIEAFDHRTGRTSAKVERQITVVAAPSPSPGGAPTITAPADGTTASGPLQVSGTAPPGTTLTIAATPTAAAGVTFTITDGAGDPVAVSAAMPAAPAPATTTADANGAFMSALSLAPGTWTITVTAGPGTSATRSVVVTPPAGLAGSLAIAGAESYLEVEEDGTPKVGVSGGISDPGESVALAARNELRIKAGNAGAVTVTVNGIRIGAMGGSGAVVEWRISHR